MLKYLLGDDTLPAAGDGMGLPCAQYLRPNNYDAIKRKLAPEGFEFVNSENITRQRTVRRPIRPPPGIRAPRSSIMTNISVSPRPSPRRNNSPASNGSERSASPALDSDNIERTPWQDFEIPQELEIIRDDAPKEIKNIVQESIDEHRAMRDSRLQAQAIVVRTTIETSGTRRKQARPVIAESSAMASARSSPASDYAGNQSDSSVSADSVTTVGSETCEKGFLKPPKKRFGSSADNSSSESLNSQKSLRSRDSRSDSQPTSINPSMAAIESKLRECKERTTKGRKLYKLLPVRRKSKAFPSPEYFNPTESTTAECTSCFDEIPQKNAVDGLPCRHKYCPPCFSQLISTAIQNEDTFPPKCCLQEIPKNVMRTHLAHAERAAYDDKALEYAVAIGSRYYCVSPECARWIDTRTAKRTNGALECPHCRVKLCTVCRGPQHPSNEDCPQDYGLDATLEQAERAGWRRCYSCRALVELNTGCRHITCTCRAEFCYTCGAKWRTCACTEADQARREQELAQRRNRYDAEARAEAEEVRAAIAAVEAAERRLAQEQQAEEARLEEEAQELVSRELERLERIAAHFQHLRVILDSVRFQQRQALERRHEQDDQWIRKMEADRDTVVAAREAQILAERDAIAARTEETLKSLQRKHAATMMETITRHRQAQDDLLHPAASSSESPDQDSDLSILHTSILSDLMPAQDLERSTLRSQHARELAKWKTRGDAALAAHDVKMLTLHMRLEEAEKIKNASRACRQREFADWKWWEALFSDRATMLAEDERRVVRSGGDVPGVQVSKAKRPVGKRSINAAAGAGGKARDLRTTWVREEMRTTWHHSVVRNEEAGCVF